MTLLKCPGCGEYTLKKSCGKCNVNTINPNPARYSPKDRYGKYRREMKKETKENG